MSIMSIWEHPNPTANPTSPAEGKLTLTPSPFPPVLYPRRACRSLISSLSPLVVCSRRSLQAVRLLIPCYLPGDNSHWHLCVFPEASQLLWTPLHRSIEFRAKDPFSKKPARERPHSCSPPPVRQGHRSATWVEASSSSVRNGHPSNMAYPTGNRNSGAATFPAWQRCRRALNAPKLRLRNMAMLTVGWLRLGTRFCACAEPRPFVWTSHPNPEKGRC